MTEMPWGWGAAWTKLRGDVNQLAWLFEEDRILTRLYMQTMFTVLTRQEYTVAEFARDMGFGPATQSPADDPEQPAQGPLDGGGESQSRPRTACDRCACEGEAQKD